MLQDYYDIVKKPMDLSTIKRKLDTGQYADPWEYVDDVWLMFDNAWLYNRKTSRVYKYCSNVSDNHKTITILHLFNCNEWTVQITSWMYCIIIIIIISQVSDKLCSVMMK